MEEWKVFDEYYAVSNKGRFASCKPLHFGSNTEWRLVKGSDKKTDGLIVVSVNGGYIPLASLVAEYFLPKEDKKKYIRYKDGNYKNLSADNLFWTDKRIKNKKAIRKIKEENSMLKEINERIAVHGMRLRIITEGLVDYLELGNAKLVADKYASVQLKNRSIKECLSHMMLNAKANINLKKLVTVFNEIEEAVNEYESSNSN